MKPGLYVKLAPRVHGIRSRIVKPHVARELLEASDWKTFLRLLRETRIGKDVSENLTAIDVERLILRSYIRDLRILEAYSPKYAKDIAGFYISYEALKDLTFILKKILQGEKVGPEDIRLRGVHPLIDRIAGEIEYINTPSRVVELVKPPLNKIISRALKNYEDHGDLGLLETEISYLALKEFAKRIELLNGYEKKKCLSVLCPRFNQAVINLLVAAQIAGVKGERLEKIMDENISCGLDSETINKIMFADSVNQVLAILRQTSFREHVTSDPYTTLSNIRSYLRKTVWRKANTVINGEPYNAGYIVAGAELSRLEAEDLVYLVVTKYSGVSIESVEKGLVIL